MSEIEQDGRSLRRTLLKGLALGAAGVAVGVRGVRGAEAAKLDVHDPQAVALGYVENAGRVDPKKFPALCCGLQLRQLPAAAGQTRQPLPAVQRCSRASW